MCILLLCPLLCHIREKAMATHSSIFAKRVLWTEEPRYISSTSYITCCWAAAAMSLQSCLTLSNPMDCSLPGSSVHRIFQVRVLEWVAIAFSLM